MSKNIFKILGKALIPNDEEIVTLETITDASDDRMLTAVNAFNYGKIEGKREERYNRKGYRNKILRMVEDITNESYLEKIYNYVRVPWEKNMKETWSHQTDGRCDLR